MQQADGMRILGAWMRIFGKKTGADQPKASDPAYEVVERSKDHVGREYHFKALIRVLDGATDSPSIDVIASSIQQEMGYHPTGYHCYSVVARKTPDPDILELTWKSWDSCD